MAADGEGLRRRQRGFGGQRQSGIQGCSWPEAARDFRRCSVAAAPRTANMRDWKPTDSIGRHRRSIRRTDGTTTSVKAGWLSTVKTVVRSRELFPFDASESETACSVLRRWPCPGANTTTLPSSPSSAPPSDSSRRHVARSVAPLKRHR